MKKLLLLLLCMPLLFSCVNEKTNKDDNKSKENNTTKLETTFNGSISVSTSILIEDNMDDNTHSLYHVNMIEESEDDIENVIAILKSYALAKETIESLPFDTSSQTIEELTRKYVNSLQIIRLEDTDVLELSIRDNSIESVNYLNKLVRNYIENDIERKRISSINTVNFITNQIDQIRDSLGLIEIKLQDYKNDHLTLDINLKTQNIYTKILQLDTELSTYKYQDQYYSYLEDYINNGNELESVISPSTDGITNPTLSALIKQLVNVQLKKNILLMSLKSNHPSIAELDLNIIEISKQIKEEIKNCKQTNSIIIPDLNNRIILEESNLNSLPIEQRELLNIERIQKTLEQLYNYLLQKKLEADMTPSKVSSNIRMIDSAILIIE
jgi:tyrosine-protein kinase Etk/Wzc